MQLLEFKDLDTWGNIGYYIKGHVDKLEFFSQAKKDWLAEQREDLECGNVDEIGDCPFTKNFIKHCYYRLATYDDVENEVAEEEDQFLIEEEPTDGFEPLTIVQFDY